MAVSFSTDLICVKFKHVTFWGIFLHLIAPVTCIDIRGDVGVSVVKLRQEDFLKVV